ncbi:hypothetical protein L226DRAFT_565512 [Lentinus tigrinus ALCF2SS1-7]|uniref:Ubiquitin-like domain-containing protein n=1 Tax=Lentinus tigrinus ALCF2SS1-6 TaxID=1328759 RepID=A0A5C2SSU4_9APHY|nr:hypothetical protein L227DRAFT_647907 [Lentinus tigrinus ALCF2SS1-6]RPD80664.1 hypothetical protein L226DRAFT_565512 [Lentinus tigrinus ALCF2SS1-7]
MSSSVRVELPAYSHSFEVQVSPSSTIRDVKHEIAKVCPGSPNPAGQRLIWRGRFLKDNEKVEDVWKPEDSKVIHLAVHPSAWTSAPPAASAHAVDSSSSSSSPRPTPTQQPRHSAGQPTPTPTYQPQLSQTRPAYPHAPFLSVAYIQYIHNLALGVLSAGAVTLPTQPSINDLETWRAAAQALYRSRGWSWPSVYDEPFPSGSAEQGAVYQTVTIEGFPYLQLATPGATPTPAQLHALRALSYTFPILSMANDPMLYVPPVPYPPHTHATATNLNERLQQLGLPALRVAHNPAANVNPNDPNAANPLGVPGAGGAEIRAIPVRALMVPLMMLAFRTLLLLYFFSPSQRPLFGLLLSVWILYEAWNAMRMVLNEGERGADGAVNPAAPNAPPEAQRAAPAAAVPNANGVVPVPTAGRTGLNVILDRMATINLAAEDAMLSSDVPASPPTLGQKTKMFITLLFMSLHPAAWDRRRTALRRREGNIRTEANAREAAEQENADGQQGEEDEARARARMQMVQRHERRPGWIREYIQRVQYTEWVDDP